MSVWEIIMIGVALAMDAFALTIANCTTYEKSLTPVKEWAMPLAFSAFQFAMPLLGFFVGGFFAGFLQSFAKFLTAGIFFILAAKIIFDILEESRGKKAEKRKKANFNVAILLLQAVATSIDALAVGITFAALTLPFSVFLAAGIIGAITFIIVAVALFIGKSLGKFLGRYAVWCGAIILFALAVKNLIEGLI